MVELYGRQAELTIVQDGHLEHRTLACCYEDSWNPYTKCNIIGFQLRWGQTLEFAKIMRDTDEFGEKGAISSLRNINKMFRVWGSCTTMEEKEENAQQHRDT